ncbi:MAG TPA: 4Fe-4S binding protein [Bacteroidales bacterium]|nr:4Fe-4S binding protein [Bacteroidales bacterium]HRT90255.1 4Fe-4S binding protein [Bacteroidales bacterium]
MNYKRLKRFRVIIAAIFLVLTGLLFTDIRHIIPESLFNLVLWLQFVPSAVKFIDAGEAAALGFMAVLILTLLTGRTYCSFICPLGILQDISGRVGGIIKKRFRRYGYKKPHTVVRYFILALTLAVTLTGGIFLLNILDPYSIFGRSVTLFAKPVVLWINNLMASAFHLFDSYALADIRIPPFRLMVYVIPALFLLLVGFLSLIKGRLYCNMICPVGTLLGLLSKVLVFRIRIDGQKCTKCGRCAVACKSSCIDFLNKEIDFSRCVVCFNCVEKCPDNAMNFGIGSLRKKETQFDPERRAFMAGSAAFLLGLPVLQNQDKSVRVPVPVKASTVKEPRTSFVSPPGSVGISNFTSRCTACSLCVSACPNNVLVPSFKQYGITGIMQPYMDYHRGFCAYECIRCLEICPAGALMPLLPEAKKLTQIGKAVFIRDNCIVETEGTACGACAESCPTKAVHMIPFKGNLTIPETTDDICIGCGHCEYACPVTPYKAIFVNGNPVHTAARKPENVQTQLKHEDFPF